MDFIIFLYPVLNIKGNATYYSKQKFPYFLGFTDLTL